VIVVGADTAVGRSITTELSRHGGEVRAFITDPRAGDELRRSGCKVAIGDVSDGSHIEIAAYECFTAVLIAEASSDERERSFADSPQAVAEAWVRAIRAAGIQRMIWVGSTGLPDPPAPAPGMEVAVLSARRRGTAEEVARLNELETLD
jgi:nucleoside-diphosphate-sugar epimerase